LHIQNKMNSFPTLSIKRKLFYTNVIREWDGMTKNIFDTSNFYLKTRIDLIHNRFVEKQKYSSKHHYTSKLRAINRSRVIIRRWCLSLKVLKELSTVKIMIKLWNKAQIGLQDSKFKRIRITRTMWTRYLRLLINLILI